MFNLSKMSLKGQVLALCGLMAFFNGAVSLINFFVQNHVQAAYAKVDREVAPNLAAVTKMRGTFRQFNLDLRTLGLEGISEEESAKARAKSGEDIKTYEITQEKFLALPALPGQREAFEGMKSEWLSFKNLGTQIMDLSVSKDPADHHKLNHFLFEEGPKAALRYQVFIDTVLQGADKASVEWSAEAERFDIVGNWVNMGVSALGILLSLVAGFFFAAALSRRLSGVVEHLSGGADGVAEASRHITSASVQLSSAATEQAASLQETAASIEEMSAMVKKNSENAEGSRMVAGQSQTSAQKGKQVVDRMITAIEEINQSNTEIMSQIEASNREISDIVRVISEIGNKTKVINDIVFQTKLLSFNASVEAARAGEHGKGFAVVAEEVGNLAQMSGNAAKEISQMLDGSIQKVEAIVSETKNRVERLVAIGREKVRGGTEVARECGVVLDDIVKNVEHVNQMTGEISEASREQAQGVSEINKAVGQLDEVTQQNASAAQDTSGAAEKLTAQAENLRASVLDLTAMIHGRDAAMREGEGHVDSSPRTSSPGMASAPRGPARNGAAAPKASVHARKASVTPIRASSAKPTLATTARPAPRQAAAGGTNIRAINGEALPSENDPRFEDV